jgi:hypothetical protein
MRKLFLLLTVVVAMTSCLESTEPQFSPHIYSSSFFVNPVFEEDSLVGFKDTLSLFYDAEDKSYKLDTVYLGDTVMFSTTYYTVNSDLISVKMEWNEQKMDLWYNLTPDIEKALINDSTTKAGHLYFAPSYNRVSFPVYFSPTQRGGMTLKLTVESTSEFPTNSVLFYIPAIEQVVDSTVTN